MSHLHPLEIILALLLASIAIALLSARLQLPYPILLVLGCLGISSLPLRSLLPPDSPSPSSRPPLLSSARFITTCRHFRANLRPITLLAVGLVLFTTAAVALVATALVPGLPLAAAFVLGAIVSPPDAVAA